MTAEPQLPDPDYAPLADVVVWDGQCAFCLSQVLRLRRFDWWHQLTFVSLHDPRVAELLPDLTFQQLMDQMWVATRAPLATKLGSDGPMGVQSACVAKYGGADAARYLSRKLPSLWWLAPLLHLPFSMPLWRYVYRVIAQRRYRISGVTCDTEGACDVHVPKQRN